MEAWPRVQGAGSATANGQSAKCGAGVAGRHGFGLVESRLDPVCV